MRSVPSLIDKRISELREQIEEHEKKIDWIMYKIECLQKLGGSPVTPRESNR